ncbi:urease accessory protein UreD [Umezawaea tangerina]|uniref:Urease accessory protein UreD n=1 Tax=Umezawaea tangerina TaxID=84725 RepID=A0A2T0TLH5_9PSEU|nr:urease accessory protein UreD [Umezawaea tangerina]PRY46461.1 urease accessory protein [Umezawaea tangerina]
MKARARLVVERDADGRNVVRDLRSMAPITLVPHRSRVRSAAAPALVHLVSSVTAPLGGDDLELAVEVGAGAHLVLRGVAATLALPGHLPGGSRARVRIAAGEGASVQYVPEPTVVTGRARHEAELAVELAAGARLRTREVLVLGRADERPGSLVSTVRVRREGGPLLHQSLRIGVPELDASTAHLAGRRVLGTEVLSWGEDPVSAVSHDWWSLVPLARGGSLVTALAGDAVTAQGWLDAALDVHPGWRSRVD